MEREHIEEIKGHVGVIAGALRDEIRQVAEGHSVIRREMQQFRNEVRAECRDVRSLLRHSFSQLDQRDATLESELTISRRGLSG